MVARRRGSGSVTAPVVWFALFGYGLVMASLTLLKAFYRIGYLWEPARQRQQGLSLMPLRELWSNGTWFGPLFSYGGNLAFFIPFGILTFVLLDLHVPAQHPAKTSLRAVSAWFGKRSPVWVVGGIGLAVSLVFEVCQYVFHLGFSDVDDVLFNALGALVGALIAGWCGRRCYGLWVALAIATTIVFVVLVGFGDILGDPTAIVDVTR